MSGVGITRNSELSFSSAIPPPRRQLSRDFEEDMMALLLEVPVDDRAVLMVEADRQDVLGDLTLAAPSPGEAAAKATRSLVESLDQLEPLLTAIRERLAATMPESFTVEFGVKFGGETGIIVAKGTAEVNLKITLAWSRNGHDGG
jgi:hypothetical protein